jgi:hypothetical protein
MNTKMIFLFIMLLQFVVLASATEHVLVADKYDGRINDFLSQGNMLNFLVPAILLLVCIVTFFIDFGAIPVTVASIVALVFMNIIGIVYFSWVSFTAFAAMIVIIAAKMQQ